MSTPNQFEWCYGSMIGREHLTAGALPVGKNNQDALCIRSTDLATIAICCDGCGSSPHSDVGANFGAQLFAEMLIRAMDNCKDWQDRTLAEILETARLNALEMVRNTAQAMSGRQFLQTISDYFLFTVIGCLVTPKNTTIFGIGDGIYAMNGTVTKLGPFPNNAPPYATYALLTTSCSPELLKFQEHVTCPTDTLESALIGTDGVGDFHHLESKPMPGKKDPVGPLSQFWTEDRYFKNSDAVRRKLALCNSEVIRLEGDQLVRHGRLLPDDTTLIALRKKKG